MRIANAIANSGSAWGEYVRYNNSGTYNNQVGHMTIFGVYFNVVQYMIIDLKLFSPGQQLQAGGWVGRTCGPASLILHHQAS